MKIAIACDHGGFELKNAIIDKINSDNEVRDFGCYSEESVDYIDYAKAVAEAVAKGDFDKGILVCGTGIGMSIAANKVKGIRAACCSEAFSAEMTRRHNDSNILCLGGRVVSIEKGIELAELFLSTEFEGGRHERRVSKITALEEEYFK